MNTEWRAAVQDQLHLVETARIGLPSVAKAVCQTQIEEAAIRATKSGDIQRTDPLRVIRGATTVAHVEANSWWWRSIL